MKAQLSKDKNNNSPAAKNTSKPKGEIMTDAQRVAGGSNQVAQARAMQLQIDNSEHVIMQRRQIDAINGGISGTVQLAEKKKEELQGKFKSNPSDAAQLKTTEKPNNTGLPDNLKSGVESLSGLSMDDVKVHYNSSKPAQLNALAYAQGTDIHVAPGQAQHLPHEAWHVAQQKQGRVKPTTQAKGVAINDDIGLEREADVMGAKAAQMKPKEEEKM